MTERTIAVEFDSGRSNRAVVARAIYWMA